MTATAIVQTDLVGLKRIHQGKVRDIYEVGDDRLLIVATDRLSAYDRVLGTGIPNKGTVLTQMSNFWFQKLAHVVPNHLLAHRASDMPEPAATAARSLGGRAVLVQKAKVVPVECVVRGYLASSRLKEYQETGGIQGNALPPGIELGGRLPEPIFTPTTKATEGHDMPMTFSEVEDLVGKDLAAQLRDVSLRLFREASAHCEERGMILCDTKFEIGHLPDGALVLVDEALTADSSRFFKKDEHEPGRNPVAWDKQFVRDYLRTLPEGSMEAPEAPTLPDEIVEETVSRYREVFERLSGRTLEEAVTEACS